MNHTDTCGDQCGGSVTNRRLSRYAKARQILDMQDVLKNNVLDPSTKPLERSSCARAWEVLEERLRIMRGKLKAGSFNARTDALATKRKRQARQFNPMEIAESMQGEQSTASTPDKPGVERSS